MIENFGIQFLNKNITRLMIFYRSFIDSSLIICSIAIVSCKKLLLLTQLEIISRINVIDEQLISNTD